MVQICVTSFTDKPFDNWQISLSNFQFFIVPSCYHSMDVVFVVVVDVVNQQVLVKLSGLCVLAKGTEPGKRFLKHGAAVRHEAADEDVLDVVVGKINRFLVETGQGPPVVKFVNLYCNES